MPIRNFNGEVLKWNGNTIDFNDALAAVGTAFELMRGENVLRRGIKMADQRYWFSNLSVNRSSDEPQDLRGLFEGIPTQFRAELEIRSIQLSAKGFAKWLRGVPQPIRDLCGWNVPVRGRPPSHAKKRKDRERAPGDGADEPLYIRVAALEDKFDFLESLLATFIASNLLNK